MKKTVVTIAMVSMFSIQNLMACSVFMSTDGARTMVGNNEDESNSYSVETFIPASGSKFGYFYMESPHDPSDPTPSHEPPMIEHYPQGGMNDQGLMYDITFTPLKGSRQVVFSPEAQILDPNGEHQGYVLRKMLAEAATVDEAIQLIQKYQMPEFVTIQVFLADKSGNSAVLGIGKDDRLSVIKNSKNYQILTNTSLADKESSIIFDPRYGIANEMLGENSSLSLKNFRSVMAAIHVEGISSTVYSTIYDLNKGDINFYYFHNFEEVVTMNLHEELKKGKHSFVMSSLFKRKIFARTAIENLTKGYMGLIEKLQMCKDSK